jgi:hypothetical protein
MRYLCRSAWDDIGAGCKRVEEGEKPRELSDSPSAQFADKTAHIPTEMRAKSNIGPVGTYKLLVTKTRDHEYLKLPTIVDKEAEHIN